MDHTLNLVLYRSIREQVGRLKACKLQQTVPFFKMIQIPRLKIDEGIVMKNDFIIITNNPLVKERLGDEYEVDFTEISYEEVLKRVRSFVYNKHELLTHPLSGSVKPNETPYKSIMVSKEPKEHYNVESMHIIDRAISVVPKFQFKSDQYADDVYDDFQYVDYSLISSALPSATAW